MGTDDARPTYATGVRNAGIVARSGAWYDDGIKTEIVPETLRIPARKGTLAHISAPGRNGGDGIRTHGGHEAHSGLQDRCRVWYTAGKLTPSRSLGQMS